MSGASVDTDREVPAQPEELRRELLRVKKELSKARREAAIMKRLRDRYMDILDKYGGTLRNSAEPLAHEACDLCQEDFARETLMECECMACDDEIVKIFCFRCLLGGKVSANFREENGTRVFYCNRCQDR